MGYRWKSKTDVDEAVVVLMNSIDEGGLPAWLVRTVEQSIDDSDPEFVTYFFKEVQKHSPKAFGILEDRRK